MDNYDFTLKETDGSKVSLSNFKGQVVVLYFYPKDNTAGCTTEAIGFRDLYDEFKELGTVILGVSRDSLSSHLRFREKQGLPFLLLSDEGQKVHNQYGVMKMKKMYGREYLGVERSTFVFDRDLKLVKEYRNVRAKGHADKVLQFIREELS